MQLRVALLVGLVGLAAAGRSGGGKRGSSESSTSQHSHDASQSSQPPKGAQSGPPQQYHECAPSIVTCDRRLHTVLPLICL